MTRRTRSAGNTDLVNTARMRPLAPHHMSRPAAIAAGQTDFIAMGMEDAYCGSPAEATPEEREATYETLTAMLVELVRGVARS